MNECNPFAKNDLTTLMEHVYAKRNQPAELLCELGSVVGNNGYGTTFILPFNEAINNVWVNVANGMVSSFGIAGKFGITLGDFVFLFGEPKKGYSRYDDKFEYSFHDERLRCYVVAFNEDDDIPDDHYLSNIKVVW